MPIIKKTKRNCLKSKLTCNEEPKIPTSPTPTTLEPAKVDTISDKELLTILSLLPLHDLLNVELVSRRWCLMARVAMHDRTSLSLLQTPNYRDTFSKLTEITRHWFLTDFTTPFPFELDCFIAKRKVTKSNVQWLGHRFSNVTELRLYFVDHFKLNRFLELIKLLPKLERLIIFSSSAQQDEYDCQSFWNTLYSIKSLDYLYISFEFNFHSFNYLIPLMPKLNSVYFKYIQDEEELIDLNKLFIANTPSKTFHITTFPIPNTSITIVEGTMTTCPNYPDRDKDFITRLVYYHHRQHERQKYRMLDSSFERLDHFEGTHLEMPMPLGYELLQLLAKLKKLVNLHTLRFVLDPSRVCRGTPLYHPAITPHNYRSVLTDVELPQIRTLHLCYLPMDQFCLQYFSLITPAVQCVHFEDCAFENVVTHAPVSARWFANALTQFGALKQIVFNNQPVIRLHPTNPHDQQTNRVVSLVNQHMFRRRL